MYSTQLPPLLFVTILPVTFVDALPTFEHVLPLKTFVWPFRCATILSNVFYVQFQLVLFCAVRSSVLIFLPHPFFYWKLKRQDLPRAWNSGSLSVTAWLWHWSRRGWLDFWRTTYCMYYWETKAVVTRCNGILPSRRMWWFVRKIELSRSMTWVHSTNN